MQKEKKQSSQSHLKLPASVTTSNLRGFLRRVKNEREQRQNTMKHPARPWFPWCVIRLDHFDVSFLPCDKGGHPPWKENGLRCTEMEKWKLPDWHSKTGRDSKSRLFYWWSGREDLNPQWMQGVLCLCWKGWHSWTDNFDCVYGLTGTLESTLCFGAVPWFDWLLLINSSVFLICISAAYVYVHVLIVWHLWYTVLSMCSSPYLCIFLLLIYLLYVCNWSRARVKPCDEQSATSANNEMPWISMEVFHC